LLKNKTPAYKLVSLFLNSSIAPTQGKAFFAIKTREKIFFPGINLMVTGFMTAPLTYGINFLVQRIKATSKNANCCVTLVFEPVIYHYWFKNFGSLVFGIFLSKTWEFVVFLQVLNGAAIFELKNSFEII
jgi:hypothetical protein